MIIGLVGFIGSGKDSVSRHFVKHGFVRDSFAAPIKDLCASIFGWPRELLEGHTAESREFRETTDIFWTRKLGIDNFTPRLALQLIGTDVMRNHFNEDIWLNSLEYRIHRANQHQGVIISDARFKNELKLIKRLNGCVIWVRRGELPEWYNDAAQANNGNAASKKIMQTRYRDIHESEWNWVGFECDHVIFNNGTVDDLEHAVLEIKKSIQTASTL